jgi:hypothetical protein
LRAVPQVHGAARDLFAHAARVVDDELASVTDNPVVVGTVDEPRALSGANAVGAALGLCADSLGVAVAEVAAMSERRLDRLVNPLVSNLPAFLTADEGASSGFMIAQYTAVSLVAENRRLGRAGQPRRRGHLGAAGRSLEPRDAGRAQAAQDHRQRRGHSGHRIAGGSAGLRPATGATGPGAAHRRGLSMAARPHCPLRR